MRKRMYFFQPEIFHAIIYWSLTFGILFISLILTLEKTRPYWLSNSVLVLFILALIFGANRRVTIEKDALVLTSCLGLKQTTLLFTQISKIRVGKQCLDIQLHQGAKSSYWLTLTKKSKQEFVAILAETPLQACLVETPGLDFHAIDEEEN